MKPQRTPRKSLSSQEEFPLKDITGRIISCAIEVHSLLGPGLLESVYEEALAHEFELRGMPPMKDRRRFACHTKLGRLESSGSIS